MKISGLDKLAKTMDDASKAFDDLDGDIATLTFDATDEASVAAAIRKMERAIDTKIRRYGGNAIVVSTGRQLKDQYRNAICERAAEAAK